MRINDPKSIVFIDGVTGLSSSVENFASVTSVSNIIDNKLNSLSNGSDTSSISYIELTDENYITPTFNSYIIFYSLNITDDSMNAFYVDLNEDDLTSGSIKTNEIWIKFPSNTVINDLTFNGYQLIDYVPTQYDTINEMTDYPNVYVFIIKRFKNAFNNKNISLVKYSHSFYEEPSE